MAKKVKIVHVKLLYPSGQTRVSSMLTTSENLKGMKKEYFATKAYARNKAVPIKIVEKPKRRIVRVIRKRKYNPFGVLRQKL